MVSGCADGSDQAGHRGYVNNGETNCPECGAFFGNHYHEIWEITILTKNQEKLKKIALKNKHKEIRLAAAEKLHDEALAQPIISKYAENAHEYWIRDEAVRFLKDQKLLAKIAKTDSFRDVRLSAARSIKDPTLKNEIKPFVYPEETKKISDQAILRQIVNSASDSKVREVAVTKLKDQKLLLKIAKRDKNLWVRQVALKHLKDQKTLKRLVLYYNDFTGGGDTIYWRLVEAILENPNLTDPKFLAMMAIKYENYHAIENPNFTDQKILLRIAGDENMSYTCRESAIKKITDLNLLQKLATDKDQARSIYYTAKKRLKELQNQK